MTAIYTNQYNPNAQKAVGDPLSTRDIRDLCDSLNNGKACVFNHPIINETFIDGGRHLRTVQRGSDDYTIIAKFAPRYFPPGYDSFTVQAVGNVPDSRSGTVNFALYLLNKNYTNTDSAFDSTGYTYVSATWDVTSSEDGEYQITAVRSNLSSIVEGRMVHILLTARGFLYDPLISPDSYYQFKSLVVRPMVYNRG